MSFTYSGDPSESDLDAVRYLVQDTVEDGHKTSDEEISWALTQESGVYNAAALVCETIAARSAQSGGSWVRGRVEVRTDMVSTQYLALAKRLREQGSGIASITGSSAFAGGISVDDKTATEADTDRISPRFYRGQFN
jgi:hypothetical protein